LEPKKHAENLDDVVDQLLRDKDYLLSKEIKHRVEELNQLLMQAQRQKLKVELNTTKLEASLGNTFSWLEVKVYKEI
jgi:hypothetical protein